MNKKMKKLGLYTMALLSVGLVGCNQDFDTEFVPQTNPQESLLQMSDVSVAASSTSTINLADYINEDEGTDKLIPIGTVSVKEGALPANTILKAEVEFSKSPDFDDSVVLDANSLDGTSEITVQASTLQDAYFNNITRNPATTELYTRTVLYTVTGGTSEAMIGEPDNNFFAERSVKFTPLNKVHIDVAYYYVGATNGWSDSDKTYKLSNGGDDPYENPVFTCTVPAPFNEDGTRAENWFKIAPEAAYTSGNFWGGLVGVKDNGDSSTSGTLVGPGDVGAFYQPASDGALYYRISINMMEMTYTITPLNFGEYLWEAGVNNNWGTEAQPLYCSDGNGTYVGFFYAMDADWSGGKGAFKFQKEFNNWDVNYGYGSGDDASGTLGGDNFMVEPGFYRAEIDLVANTYKLTKITTVGIVGPAQAGGWSDDTDMTYNKETGAWEATLDLAADELKFRANDGWDINWGGESTDALTQGGPNLKVATAGKYFVQLFAYCDGKSYCKLTKK